MCVRNHLESIRLMEVIQTTYGPSSWFSSCFSGAISPSSQPHVELRDSSRQFGPHQFLLPSCERGVWKQTNPDKGVKTISILRSFRPTLRVFLSVKAALIIHVESLKQCVTDALHCLPHVVFFCQNVDICMHLLLWPCLFGFWLSFRR